MTSPSPSNNTDSVPPAPLKHDARLDVQIPNGVVLNPAATKESTIPPLTQVLAGIGRHPNTPGKGRS
jgi:hypothetical protein